MELKKCTRCKKEHSEDNNYCFDCKKYFRDISSRPNRDPGRNEREGRKLNIKSNKCVYAFKEGDEYVYIGESKNTPYRVSLHYGRKKGDKRGCFHEFPVEVRKERFTHEILWEGDNDMMRKIQEKTLIMKHQPRFNKVYKTYSDE